jgi:hypothetical protein
MQFHQGHRDDRRRRALVEDQSQADSETDATTSRPSRSSRRNEVYAAGAKPENQHRITDLVPASYVTVGLWFFGGLLVIVALAAGHLWMPRLASAMAEERLSVLELGAPGALGCWFASLALGMASIFSLVVYSIQRHKVSDYRGHYRWWLLAAALWLVMSMDSTAAVHDLFRIVMTRLSGYSAPAGGAVWWIACWGLLLVTVSIRLVLDMKVCRAATVAYSAALGCWCLGLAIGLSGTRFGALGSVVPAEFCKLLGHLLLLSSLVIYSRHILLHVQGLLPQRKSKAAKEKARRETKTLVDAAGNTLKIDAAHHSAGSTASRTDLKPHVSPNNSSARVSDQAAKIAGADDSDEYDDEDDAQQRGRKLSKAERRKMRRAKAEERDW